MPLGKKTQAFLNALPPSPSAKEKIESGGIEKFRQDAEFFYQTVYMPPHESIEIIDKTIPGFAGSKTTLKIYAPKGTQPGDNLPTLVYFPGGGALLDLKKAYDHACSELAKQINGIVIKVSCRLSPQYTRLDAFDDAYAATKYCYQHANDFGGSQHKFAVGGNSSGSQLATLITNQAKSDTALNIQAQVLITPSVDMSLTQRIRAEFRTYQDQDVLLPKEDQEYYTSISMPKDIDAKDPRISPYYADPAGVPHTIMVYGEYDGIRGDAEAYREKLQAANISTDIYMLSGQIHAAMLCYKILDDGPYQATVAGEALNQFFKLYKNPT
jgi:acetyl esterase